MVLKTKLLWSGLSIDNVFIFIRIIQSILSKVITTIDCFSKILDHLISWTTAIEKEESLLGFVF